MHLSWDQMRQLYISPLILLYNLTMDLFDAAIRCSVRLFQNKSPKTLIVKGLLQFQKSFFCYIYQPSRRRRVFNYIIRAKRRPSPEVLPAWSCFRLAAAALPSLYSSASLFTSLLETHSLNISWPWFFKKHPENCLLVTKVLRFYSLLIIPYRLRLCGETDDSACLL